MTLERYVYAGTRRLRCGYTTGSCAAMAAQAACRMLLGEPAPARVALTTPNGVRVEADVLDAARAEDGTWARCAIRKDGGDDVDATDGLLIYAEVRFADGDAGAVGDTPAMRCVPLDTSASGIGGEKVVAHIGSPRFSTSSTALSPVDASGSASGPDAKLLRNFLSSDASSAVGVPLVIRGGEGVGRVTRPGLEQPVGEAAINSVPRAMIAEQVGAVLKAHGVRLLSGASEGSASDATCSTDHVVPARPVPLRTLVVTISVPGGERVAARTFNPQLGIEGGISILGTTGIVEPRSVAALVDSIELEMRQHAAEGAHDLVLVPGNYGRDFVAAHLPQLADVPLVSCSNYLGDALDFAARHGFGRVLLVGHIGKLAKVAAGVMNTHSRVADCRCEAICAHAALAGADRETARRLMDCATTEACLDVLDEVGLLTRAMASLTVAIADHVERRAAGAYEAAVILFSQVRGELARSTNADELIGQMKVGARRSI